MPQPTQLAGPHSWHPLHTTGAPRAATPSGKLLLTAPCSLPQNPCRPLNTSQMTIQFSLNNISFNYNEEEIGKKANRASQSEEFKNKHGEPLSLKIPRKEHKSSILLKGFLGLLCPALERRHVPSRHSKVECKAYIKCKGLVKSGPDSCEGLYVLQKPKRQA